MLTGRGLRPEVRCYRIPFVKSAPQLRRISLDSAIVTRRLESSFVPVAVEFDPTTLQRSELGTISGVLYLQLGSQSFPEKGWNDLPVAVLQMWLNALRPLRSGQCSEAECPFMDGPFMLRVQRTSVSAWQLEGLANGTRVQVESIDSDELWQNLQKAARRVVEECRTRKWESRDVATLSQLLTRIDRERAV